MARSGSNSKAKSIVFSIVSLVSPGLPNIKEHLAEISFFLVKLTAVFTLFISFFSFLQYKSQYMKILKIYLGVMFAILFFVKF